jgi:hypothetical protein
VIRKGKVSSATHKCPVSSHFTFVRVTEEQQGRLRSASTSEALAWASVMPRFGDERQCQLGLNTRILPLTGGVKDET